MKLLLCSEGFLTPNTVQACVDLVGKPQDQIKLAIINEAHVYEKGDKRWVLNNLNDAARSFPAPIDIIDILALSLEEIEQRINKCDVIFVIGGNSDYLVSLFRRTGFDKLLVKLLKTKVYVGSSAGSMVMGKRISSQVYEEVFGDRHDFGNTKFLEFVDFALIPHVNSVDLLNNSLNNLKTIIKDNNFPVYTLEDDSAIVLNEESISTTGTNFKI